MTTHTVQERRRFATGRLETQITEPHTGPGSLRIDPQQRRVLGKPPKKIEARLHVGFARKCVPGLIVSNAETRGLPYRVAQRSIRRIQARDEPRLRSRWR